MNIILAFFILFSQTDKPPETLIPCKVISVHDGDTLVVDVNFPWDVTLREQTVRCQGYDAPEITKARRTVKITDEEIKRGIIARDAFKSLLQDALVYVSPSGNRDPYGRLPAYILVWKNNELIDVKEWMKKEGHIR